MFSQSRLQGGKAVVVVFLPLIWTLFILTDTALATGQEAFQAADAILKKEYVNFESSLEKEYGSGRGCDDSFGTPAYLRLEGGWVQFYICSGACFDSRSIARFDELDMKNISVQPNHNVPGRSFVHIPCKAGHACVKVTYGTGVGFGSKPNECRKGPDFKSTNKNSFNIGANDAFADEIARTLRTLRLH